MPDPELGNPGLQFLPCSCLEACQGDTYGSRESISQNYRCPEGSMSLGEVVCPAS